MRRLGRPPHIDLERIVAAAKGVGVEGLSMSAVAERLGVSVSGLYHHVKGRDELARLVARSTLAEGDLPPDDGQPWADWMLAYARFLRQTLREHRGTISHVHPGETGSPTSLDRLEQVMHVLRRAGFSVSDALLAFMVVTNCISGFVHQDNQIESEARAGRPYIAEFYRALAERQPEELPILRSVTDPLAERDRLFDDQIRIVLAGVAAWHARPARGETTSEGPPRVRTGPGLGRAVRAR